jgi:dolichyl-phosphate beta-glucosyltransferase
MEECTIAEVVRPLFLSIVVPAYNEQSVIGRFIDSVRSELGRCSFDWEAIIVDDGSVDDTLQIVRAAMRQGFLAARGEWVLMADADLSMPWDNLPRFLAIATDANAPQIIIGSREAPGAQRSGETWRRRVSGRAFNAVVRLFAVPGVRDSQCGYKMLSAQAVSALAPHLTLDGFAFDVELLYLARLAGLRIREVGIVCHCRPDSRVRVKAGLISFLDVMRMRLRRRGTFIATASSSTVHR